MGKLLRAMSRLHRRRSRRDMTYFPAFFDFCKILHASASLQSQHWKCAVFPSNPSFASPCGHGTLQKGAFKLPLSVVVMASVPQLCRARPLRRSGQARKPSGPAGDRYLRKLAHHMPLLRLFWTEYPSPPSLPIVNVGRFLKLVRHPSTPIRQR